MREALMHSSASVCPPEFITRSSTVLFQDKKKNNLNVQLESNYLVPHAKQATQCPHGRKKQSLGASKQMAQRRRVLLPFSPSLDFPSSELAARKSSRPSSSFEAES
jgi:hypothetical protein